MRTTWTSLFLTLIALTDMSASTAHAAGLFQLESDGFLRTSDERDTSSYILTVGPKFTGQSDIHEGEVNIHASTYIKDPVEFTLESPSLYIATSRKLMDHNQFTLGRRQFDWSTFDDQWTFGLWSPRFIWDPLHPEKIGLTGVFYEHHSSIWRVLAYASPISIPERSYPVHNAEGKIYSDSPYAIPLPSKVVMISQPVDINYNINNPNYRDILTRPAGAVQIKYGRNEGYWGSLGYGVMPIHQIDLAVDASLNINASTPRMDANIYPRFPMHHLLTAESGYVGKNWGMWASVSGEQPLTVETQPNWIANSTGPALISAAGASLTWQQSLTLSGSYLFVLEKDRGLTGPSTIGSIDLDLPERFPYRRAWQIGGHWDHGSPTMYGVKWTHDAENTSSLISADFGYRPAWKSKLYRYETWTFGVGADFISSKTGKGTIGKYQGDDRVRGGVTYAF